MAITAEQARNMLKTIETNPERWAASVNTIVADLVERLDKATAILRATYNAAKQTAGEVEQINRMLSAIAQGVAPDAGAPDAEVAAVQGDVPNTPGVRTTDAGPVTSPDQLAAEALMDAAIGDSSPPPVAQTPRVRRANGNGAGARRPPAAAAAPVAPRNGADGKPLDPEQAAIEAAMDAAIGG